MLTFVSPGMPPLRVRTDGDGAYRILLPVATYTVSAAPSGLKRSPYPAHVRVRAGHLDRIDFSIDTGIR